MKLIKILLAFIAILAFSLSACGELSPKITQIETTVDAKAPPAEKTMEVIVTQTPAVVAEINSSSPTNIQTVSPTNTKTVSPTNTQTVSPTNTQTVSPTLESKLEFGSTLVSENDGMVQVYVPAGAFMMGNHIQFTNEDPPHEVTLDAFWIDRTEVTNVQFAKFIKETGYQTDAEILGSGYALSSGIWQKVNKANWQHPQGPESNLDGLEEHPVVQVSWDDAKAYCEWAGRRLPTEAEWEKAARGTDSRTYPWGETAPTGNLVNFADKNTTADWANKSENDGYQFTAPVGSYPSGASLYGAFDMAGNVDEWVNDWYDAFYYQNSPSNNPPGPVNGNLLVLRGGSWHGDDSNLRTGSRSAAVLGFRYTNVGIRCAATP